MFSPLKLLFLAMLLSLGACGTDSRSSISDDPRSQGNLNSQKSVIHSTKGWREVVKVYVSELAPALVVDATNESIRNWNDAAGFELLSFAGISSEGLQQSDLYSTLNDLTTMVYFDEKNWAQHTGKASTTLATTVWENSPENSDEIVRADIILNAESYLFIDALDSENAYLDADNMVDAESVITHELGHLLGINHVGVIKDRDSVMHAQTYVGYGVAKRTPSDGDRKLISEIYKEPLIEE
jgi:hypothetical protein